MKTISILRRTCALAFIPSILVVSSALSYGFPRYTITRLAPEGNWENAGCEGMAPNAGYVVGIQLMNPPLSGSLQATYRWQAPGPLVPMLPMGAKAWNHGYAVNDLGKVVGYSAGYNASVGQAWIWDGGPLPPAPLDDGTTYWTCANGINNYGLIVGRRLSQAGGVADAVLWQDWQMKLVGTGQTELGRRLIAAWGVNDHGLVVGTTDDPVYIQLNHAFLWDGNPSHNAVDLPELLRSRTTQAVAVNEAGQAVGATLLMNWNSHAVLWDTDGSLHVIPPPRGIQYSGSAEAINDAGWVVGQNWGPWVWNKEEGTAWLRSLVVGPEAKQWRFFDSSAGAMGIDNQGRIAGQAICNGQIAAFLLTPVKPTPVPVTIDVKPGSELNSINPRSQGTIPVAILSTESFDVLSQVDPTSLTFGRTGTENSLSLSNPEGEDVDGDGRLDLVAHFRTADTGFQCGDTFGVLQGVTVDGQLIEGRDKVRITPCK